MIASQWLRIATVSTLCTLLAMPASAATGLAVTGERDDGVTSGAAGARVYAVGTRGERDGEDNGKHGGDREDRTDDDADRADDDNSTGATDATGEHGPPVTPGTTGPTDTTGATGAAGGDGQGLVPTSPDAPGAAPVPEDPSAPPGESPGAPIRVPTPVPAPRPGDGDTNSPGGEPPGTGGAGQRGANGDHAPAEADGAAASGARGSRGDRSNAASRARAAVRDSGRGGVQGALVVTKLVERIPRWMRLSLAALTLAAVALGAVYLRERRRRRIAEQDAMVDTLTGISNRKAFDRRLDLEWRRASRYGRELGLMIVDLDGFKLVNDNHGHSAGDRLLREVAEKLDGRMRDTDLVARIGGDEFAVICPETGLEDLAPLSAELAEKATDGLSRPVGVSIGVAEYRPGDAAAAAMLDRADASMYRVKRGDCRQR